MSDIINITVSSNDPHITYSPADAWQSAAGIESTDGQAEFLRGDDEHGKSDAFITFAFTHAATAFQYWGYQNDDAGNFSICFDCAPTSTFGEFINALNTSIDGLEPPRLLYVNNDLSYGIHNVTIANHRDMRADPIANGTSGGGEINGYGQMTLDRFVLSAPRVPPTAASGVAPSTSTAKATSATPSSQTQTSTPNPTPTQAPSKSVNVGAIAGGVVGGLAFAALIGLILCFCLRRRRKTIRRTSRQSQDLAATDEPKAESHSMTNVAHVVPFILPANDGAITPADRRQSKRQNSVPTTEAPGRPEASASRPAPPNALPSPQSPAPSPMSAVPSPQSPGPSPQSPVPGPAVPIIKDRPPAPAVVSNPGADDPPSAPLRPPASRAPSIPMPLRRPTSLRDPAASPPLGQRESDAGYLAGELGEEPEPVQDTLPPDYEAATARRRSVAGARGRGL